MEENFFEIFFQAQSCKNSQLIKLPHPKILSNPYSQQEYLLTHRYTFSPNTFTCTDLSLNNLHLKVIPCRSYTDLKQGANSLSGIQQKCQSNALLETFDSFEILDEGKWYLIIVTPTMESASLLEIGKSFRQSSTIIPRHHSISILSALIEVVEEISSSSTLNCIFPNTVLICKHSVGPALFEIKGQKFSLKVSPLSIVTLLSLENSLFHLKRPKNSDLWDISIALYSLIGKSSLESLPQMKDLSDSEIQKLTPLSFEDPALEQFFRNLQKLDFSVFRSNSLKIWRACLNLKHDIIERTLIEDLPALHSVLLFTNYSMKSMVLRQLLILGKNAHEVYVYLNENNIFWPFIEECLQISWEDNKFLLEAFFMILKQKPQDNYSKLKLRKLGIMSLVYTTARLDPLNGSFLDFIKGFMSENTLTVMQILFDTGILSKISENVKKNAIFKAFIKDTMSYYGPNAPKLIEEVHGLEVFPAIDILQALIDIPYYFKFEKLEQIFLLILNLIKRKKYPRDEFLDVIKNTVRLLTELLTLPLLIQNNHLNFNCSSHMQQELFYLSKNPFLYYCITCSEPLCSACLKYSEHQTHEFYNLLYITPHFRCNCAEIHKLPKTCNSEFTLPKYRPRFTFLPSPGTTTAESYINRFYCKSELVITTNEPLVTDWSLVTSNIIVYYEIKVIQAGHQENITIGFLGAEVTYEGINGNISVGNQVVCKGPRFGSYDTVGIGILRTQKAFFTYNGMLSSHLIDVEANQELKIYITICGDGCEIEVRLRNFFFRSFKPGLESLNKDSQCALQEIFEFLVSQTKKMNETRLQEIKKNLVDLLKSMGKEKLAKKLL